MGHETAERLRRHNLLSYSLIHFFCGLFYPCIYSFSCLSYTWFSSPFIYPFYPSHENLTKNHFPLKPYSYVFLLMVTKNAGGTKSFWLTENHTARNEIFKKKETNLRIAALALVFENSLFRLVSKSLWFWKLNELVAMLKLWNCHFKQKNYNNGCIDDSM